MPVVVRPARPSSSSRSSSRFVILLFMGLFDFGRAVFAYNSLSNAAREGARVAIVDQTVVAGVPVGATEAANQATGLGARREPTSTPSRCRTCCPISAARAPGRSLGCIAEVAVHYKYVAITPIIGSLIGPIDLKASTQLPIEFTKP